MRVFTQRGWVIPALFFMLLGACAMTPQSRKDYLKDWTILIYMVADNNLDSFSLDDINEMEQGVDLAHSDVVVYLDRVVGSKPSYPVVLSITNDSSSDIVSPIVKSYQEQNSCDWHALRDFIDFAKTEFPSRHYGLIFWSHGSGWLSASYPQWVGLDVSDNDAKMEVSNLNQAIEGEGLSFLGFDAFLMGDVELAYTLRQSVPLLLFSQTEILSGGFPYDKVLPLFKGGNTIDILKGVARNYFDYYETQKLSFLRSASISVVQTSHLTDLAKSVSNLLWTYHS